MLAIEPKGTRAVLMGASKFPKDPENLLGLPAVERNLKDLRRILSDPDIVGIPRKNIINVLNVGLAQMGEGLLKGSREATDTLIVYYAGPGLLTDTSDLFLATINTTVNAAEFNAMPYRTVQLVMDHSPAKKRILFLDCSYSGRAIGSLGDESLSSQPKTEPKNICAIVSSSASQSAFALKDAKHTAFTGELVQVLERGIDNGKAAITLDDIFQQIRSKFQQFSFLSEPQMFDSLEANRFNFARNQEMSTSQRTRLFPRFGRGS